jgi:pilus assembly protein CpaE
VLLVVNRWQKSSRITREVIAESTGMPVAAALANDFTSLTRSVNRGTLLHDEAPRSQLARDVESLATLLRGEAAAAAPRRRGPFGRLFSARA